MRSHLSGLTRSPFSAAVVVAVAGCSSSSGSSDALPAAPPADTAAPPPPPPPQATPPLPPLPDGVTALSIPPAAAELGPLDAIAARASVIGLGESIHASGGFVDAKAALVRHLIETQGYRAIAFESPRASVEAKMAPYVASCAGDPSTAMKSLFSVWWSAATRDLMAWLCAYDQTHRTDPVTVVGFDIQEPEADSAALAAFLPRAAGADAAALVAGIAKCSAKYEVTTPYAKPDYDACTSGLDAVDAYVASHEAAMSSSLGVDAVADAKLTSRSYRAWQVERFTYASDEPASYEARDVGMAAVFADERARKLAGKKTIVWAHNYHLTERHGEARSTTFPNGTKTMGTVVREELGEAYAAVGFVGYDVQIDWPGVGEGHVLDPSGDAYEVLLHGLARPSLFVRLDRTTGDLAGAVVRPVGTPSEETIAPGHQFDALLYLDVSPPMKRLDG